MRLIKAVYQVYRKIRTGDSGYVLDDGTVILGNMRCYRPEFGDLKCKECGEEIGLGDEYWMSKHTSMWSGGINEPVTQGYCRGCAAEKADILVRKPLMLYLNDSTEERCTI